jgi:hypothetical protein
LANEGSPHGGISLDLQMPYVDIWLNQLSTTCQPTVGPPGGTLPSQLPIRCHINMPRVTPIFLGLTKLLPAINFTYDFRLMHHLKYENEIYILMLFLGKICDGLILSIYGSPGIFVSIRKPPRPLWPFLISSWINVCIHAWIYIYVYVCIYIYTYIRKI